MHTFCFLTVVISLKSFITAKKATGKSREEAQKEKKKELEKRLNDVQGQLGSAKKPSNKG